MGLSILRGEAGGPVRVLLEVRKRTGRVARDVRRETLTLSSKEQKKSWCGVGFSYQSLKDLGLSRPSFLVPLSLPYIFIHDERGGDADIKALHAAELRNG